MQKNSPPSAPQYLLFRLVKCFVSEQSPDKINEGDRRPFSEGVWPTPRPHPTPGWRLSSGCGDFGSRSDVPQADKASSLLTQPGCSQPSRLPLALWLQAGYLCHHSDNSLVWSNTSELGSCGCHPSKYPSVLLWRNTRGEETLLQLFLFLSPAPMGRWLVDPADPCGMWVALGRQAGGRVCSTGTRWSWEGALLPAGAGALGLNQPYHLCRWASLIQNYLVVCILLVFVCTA